METLLPHDVARQRPAEHRTPKTAVQVQTMGYIQVHVKTQSSLRLPLPAAGMQFREQSTKQHCGCYGSTSNTTCGLSTRLSLNVIQHFPLCLHQHCHVQEYLMQLQQAGLKVLHSTVALLNLSKSVKHTPTTLFKVGLLEDGLRLA
eukprot:GHUV01057525.1.p1 GENE.GHUV01057525.1~~GHUV01057525.1.p1  ORF type:complete len:146 (-),score=15.52 GHUV01057525.1:8-445(-)